MELWVPAAELPEFNSNIVGRIEVVSEWHGEPPVSKSPDLDGAHRHCGLNRNEIARSANCGCFYCVATFAPSEIHEWVDVHDGLEEGPARLGEKGTALCPRCGIDAVLGSASGLPVGDTDFLRRMNGRWFS